MTTPQITDPDLLDGYQTMELAACLFAAARRLMMTESEETYSASRALEAVRKDVFRPSPEFDDALVEALRLVNLLGKLPSLDVLVAGEAIMTDRAYR
jgi:hypothetical protein